MARQTIRTDIEVDAKSATAELKKLGGAADSAAVDIDQLADKLKQTGKASKDAGSDVRRGSDDIESSGKRVKGAMDDSRDSTIGAASAMGEAFGQGGTATDALGSMSEVVESLSESFGPFGAVVAGVGGLILGAFAGAAAKADELRAKAGEVFDALVDGQGQLDRAYRQQAVHQFIKDNKELVDQVGVLLGPGGLKDLGDAIGGNDGAYRKLNQTVEDRLKGLYEESDALIAQTRANHGGTAEERARLIEIGQSIKTFEDLNGKIDENAGVINEASRELQAENAMLGQTTSSMGAYTSSVTTNATELQRNIDWQKQQTSKLYDAATAAQVAKDNVLRLNAAYASRTARGEAPEGNASYIEGKGWVYNSGPNIGKSIPGRAAGGPVTAGMPVTVGEYGRETFIPQTNGTIVPNGGSVGSAVTIHQTIVTNDPMKVAQKTAEALRRQKFRAG